MNEDMNGQLPPMPPDDFFASPYLDDDGPATADSPTPAPSSPRMKVVPLPVKPPPEPPYVLETAAQVAEPLPPLDFICEGLRLARGSMTIVGGYGYSRKTLYAQAMALAGSTGTSALGVYRTAHVKVLHIDYEQGHRITRERYQRLARASGLDLAGASLNVVTLPRFKLTDKTACETLRKLLEESRAQLVVLDSLRASVTGSDIENSSEIREYIDLVAREVKRIDAAAIIIHHARKPGMDGATGGRYSLRGSGAIFDACDGVFVFSGEKGEPTLVEHEKDRLVGTELPPFGLTSEDVEMHGEKRWGLRLVHLEAEQMRTRNDAKRLEDEVRTKAEIANQIADYMRTLPMLVFAGSRSSLAAQIGGRRAQTMAAIADLVSSGKLTEVLKGRATESLRWVTQ